MIYDVMLIVTEFGRVTVEAKDAAEACRLAREAERIGDVIWGMRDVACGDVETR